MPREVFDANHNFLPRKDLLSYEEISRFARLAVSLGVEKIRLTGGEPLLRRDLPDLIRQLVAIEGLQDVCATTNGVLLTKLASELKDAGLARVTVSLDSLDDAVFRKMNDAEVGVDQVLEGLKAAHDAGLGPVKINAVVQRGVNDHTLEDMVRWAKDTPYVLRFIEFMDVGNSNGWNIAQTVPAQELLERIHAVAELEPLPSRYLGEVAKRYRFKGGEGEIGVITSVSQPFCSGCTRLRLAPNGQLFTCLFATSGFDIRRELREGKTDEEILQVLSALWTSRDDRYSELRSSATQNLPKVEMSFIGG